MEVFWSGPNLSIEHAFYYDGEGWKREQSAGDGSVSTISGMAALARNDTHIECWWSDNFGTLRNVFWDEGIGWGASTLPRPNVGQPENLPVFSSNIAAVSRYPATMELFCTDTLGYIQDYNIYIR